MRICLLLIGLIAGTMSAHGRTLEGERLEKWVAPVNRKNAELVINGESRTLSGNPGPISVYFNRRDATDLLPENYTRSASDADRECADRISENVYRLRTNDALSTLPADLTWSEDPLDDTNWQVRFHRLDFLDCLMKGYVATGNEWYIDRLKFIIADWQADNMRSPSPNPKFSWYDHAIPLRMFNVMRAVEFLVRTDHMDKASAKSMLSLIHLHADILANEDYIYSKNHNHGLDQSFRLLQAAHYFPEFVDAPQWRATALERIEYEIGVAITPEGIHRENTPSYHDGITAYIARILKSVADMGETIPGDFRDLSERALTFTAAITLPNGRYPSLGDTPAGRRAVGQYPDIDTEQWLADFRANAEQTTFLWPESGYFVHRSGWGEDDTHLLMKCGFLSGAHRHDDDGGILLYGLGEPWLIEAGYYGYPKSNSDEYRFRDTALRAESHNLTMPIGAETNRSKPYGSGLSSDGGEVVCRVPMFTGYEYERRLQVATDARFMLRDSITPAAPSMTLFRIPIDKEVTTEPGKITAVGANGVMTIAFDPAMTVRLAVGPDAEPPSFETVGYRKIRDAQTAVVEHSGLAEFVVTLSAD